MSDDYEVGYGKPPKKHQFQPGNQAARKKGVGKRKTLSLAEALDRALNTRRRIRRGDKVLDMRVGEILVERLVQMVATGSSRDLVRVVELIERHAPKHLEQAASELTITYHRAPGSTVPLPNIEPLS